MRLALHFAGGEVSGGGSDDTGAFGVQGFYRSSAVELIKSYPTHLIHYKGTWDGSILSGRWNEVGYSPNNGVFELWPEGEDVSLLEFTREDELAGI